MVEDNFWAAKSASTGSHSLSVKSDQRKQPKEMVEEKKRSSGKR